MGPAVDGPGLPYFLIMVRKAGVLVTSDLELLLAG